MFAPVRELGLVVVWDDGNDLAAIEQAIRAAEAHNEQGVFDVGAEVYEVCTSCHAKYAAELTPPNTRH